MFIVSIYKRWRSEILPVFFIIIGLVTCWEIQGFERPFESRSVRISVNPDVAIHLVLGQKMIAADFSWLDAIQGFDYYKPGLIDQGWLFHLLDFITTLDPRFEMPVIMGATTLSVLVHDKEGARLLFEKGIKNFPHNWSLIYRAAYHYLYEIHDCKRAAHLLNESSKYGAPRWVSDLAVRLYTKTAQYELARSVLLDALERSRGTSTEILFVNRLKELEEYGPQLKFSENAGPVMSQCVSD